jgi:hypothetical protein
LENVDGYLELAEECIRNSIISEIYGNLVQQIAEGRI